MTLNGQSTLMQKKLFYGAHQKNLNEDRTVLSVAKCRQMFLVSRNVSYMQIFAGVPGGGGFKRQ